MKIQDVTRPAIRTAWQLVPILAILAYIAIELQRVASVSTISNLDYFPLVDRARLLSFRSLEGWVNQIQPVGFPWLIRLGLGLGWDAARIGQALSITGGVLGLLGTYRLAASALPDRRMASLAVALVAITNQYLYFGSIEGNDMLAAGLHVLALGLLATCYRQDGLHLRTAVLAGLVAGLAYLVRYTGMITAGVGLLWLMALSVLDRRRRTAAAWRVVVIYAAAFMLATALQTIPTTIVKGSPFAVDQGQNVWFHLYGKTDFISEFEQAPQGITVLQLFLGAPRLFLEHWWGSFERFWIAPELALLDVPFKLFAQAGLVFLLLAAGPADLRRRGLIALFVAAHLATLAMMRLDRRFLIMLIPVLEIGAVYFFAALVPPRWETRRALPLNLLVLIAGLAWAVETPIGFVQGRPAADHGAILTSNILHAAGMRSPQEVLSTNLKLQDASAPARDRFPQAYWVAPELASVQDLVNAMRSHGWRFVIYDRETGARVYPALENLLATEQHPAELGLIYATEERDLVIYRLAESQGCLDVGTQLAGGISLECYQVVVSRDAAPSQEKRLGLYLHWKAQSKPDASYKVFVHMLDAQGQLVAQDDDIPVVWTFPTDTWQPGQLVVDFHQIPLDARTTPGEYTLNVGLYDEVTGARVARVDAAGHVVDDKISLKLQIPQ
jgi:hypothetical protein